MLQLCIYFIRGMKGEKRNFFLHCIYFKPNNCSDFNKLCHNWSTEKLSWKLHVCSIVFTSHNKDVINYKKSIVSKKYIRLQFFYNL